MNNKMRKLFARLAFTKQQRGVMYRALSMNYYRFKQEGNVDAAAEIKQVMDEVGDRMGVIQKRFTSEEVDQIVDITIHETFRRAREMFEAEAKKEQEECAKAPFMVGQVLDFTPCETCERRDKCPVGSAVMPETGEDNKQETENNDQETAPTEETAPEGTNVPQEDKTGTDANKLQ